jgi:hypothetical protein
LGGVVGLPRARNVFFAPGGSLRPWRAIVDLGRGPAIPGIFLEPEVHPPHIESVAGIGPGQALWTMDIP